MECDGRRNVAVPEYQRWQNILLMLVEYLNASSSVIVCEKQRKIIDAAIIVVTKLIAKGQ